MAMAVIVIMEFSTLITKFVKMYPSLNGFKHTLKQQSVLLGCDKSITGEAYTSSELRIRNGSRWKTEGFHLLCMQYN